MSRDIEVLRRLAVRGGGLPALLGVTAALLVAAAPADAGLVVGGAGQGRAARAGHNSHRHRARRARRARHRRRHHAVHRVVHRVTQISGPPSGSVGSAPASGGCADTHLMPSPSNLGRVASATLCLINEQRSQAGLSALSDNAVLDRVARAHSDDMTSRGYFDHVSPGGSSPESRMMQAGYISNAGAWMIGENIAWGTMSLATPASIVDGWMHSPEHRANILNGRFRDSGIGVSPLAPVRGIGQAGATYTQDFGSVG